MQILTTVTAPKASNGIDPRKFSNWRKRIGVTARIHRLAVKIRLRKYDIISNPDLTLFPPGRGRSGFEVKYDQHEKEGSLTPEEPREAEINWINQALTNLYSRLNRSEFKSLSPLKDENGVIRVGGRADEAIVSYETRHPAFLRRDH